MASHSSTLAWRIPGTEEPSGLPSVGWRTKKSYSTFKVRRGGCEEIPLVQGKERRLHFAGTAVKRYPTSKVRENNARFIK